MMAPPNDNERYDFRLENDSSMIISGPSKCGKTTFVIDLIRRKDRLFRHPIRNVYWFHGASQGHVHEKLCSEMGVIMKEGVPSEDDFEPIQQHDLVVLDDLQDELKQNSHITSLFLKQSHHRDFFVILLQQNIYGDKEQRFRNSNVHYWVGFNNPRNQRQLGEFLSRMYPSGKQSIYQIFNHIIENEGNYGYLFVDFTASMRADLRLRSHIFTSPMRIYKVLDKGVGFSEWLALSTLNERAGSEMTYNNMVFVPKTRYKAMVGGATNSQVLALLNPKKAYAKESAKELVDFKISPENVNDYYNKLIQFDTIRRDFFLPKPISTTQPTAAAVKPVPEPVRPTLSAPEMEIPDLAKALTPSLESKYFPRQQQQQRRRLQRLKERHKQAEDKHTQRFHTKPRLTLRDRNARANFSDYAKFSAV
jgi:hypothetical protein